MMGQLTLDRKSCGWKLRRLLCFSSLSSSLYRWLVLYEIFYFRSLYRHLVFCDMFSFSIPVQNFSFLFWNPCPDKYQGMTHFYFKYLSREKLYSMKHLDFPSSSETLMFCSSPTCCGCCWWDWDFCPPCSAVAFLHCFFASSTSETSCPIVAGSCNHSKSPLTQHYYQIVAGSCNHYCHISINSTLLSMRYHNALWGSWNREIT